MKTIRAKEVKGQLAHFAQRDQGMKFQNFT